MKEKYKELHYNRSLFSIRSYIFFFLIISFSITCCMLLFLNYLEVDYETTRESRGITFLNVMFISVIVTILEGIYHKITIEYPIRQILKASQKVIEGDFFVRVKPLHIFGRRNEMDVLIANFNIMAEELSGVETLRNDFISNVSHELKTPVSIIQNYADRLKKMDVSEDEQKEYARIISNASRRLTSLITNILKLNKLENQQIFPQLKEFDLGNQLTECILNMDDVLERKKLELETDIEERVKVRSDVELLELVWNNLLSNAVKFTEPGGTVAVSLRTEGNQAYIKVSDTGCGIDPEIGCHIFEKFYQGDTSHATQGNGLGLALVKRVVDIIGGNVFVESEIGKGSTFTVCLEMAEKEDG